MELPTGGPVFALDGIVPAELALPSGRGLTLRLEPGAHLEADDVRHFLGRGRQVFCFRTAEELAAFVATEQEHTLAHRPVWPEVRTWPVPQFVPAAVERHDLLGLVHRLREGTALEIDAGLADAVDVVADIAEQCDLADVEDMLGPDSAFWALLEAGGGADPARMQAELAGDWGRIVAAVDRAVGWPPVVVPPHLHAPPVAAPDDGGPQPLEDVAALEVVWLGLGDRGAGYTLRERSEVAGDPDQRWLGRQGRLVLAGTAEALAAYVGERPDDALARVRGWETLPGREVDWEPYEDCVVDLGEVADLIGPDLDAEGAGRVLEAYWALFFLATAQGYADVLACLDEAGPLGRFVVGAVSDVAAGDPRAALRLGDDRLGRVRQAWDEALDALAAHVRWV